jgi:TonB family protein
MSDVVAARGMSERKRTWASLATAFAIHAGIIILLALAVDWGAKAPLLQPFAIDVQLSAPPAAEPSAQAPVKQEAAVAVPSVAAAAAAAPAGKAASQAGAGDFVIPTPRVLAGDTSTPAASGPAFKEAGGKTGSVAALPAVQGQAPAPAVAPAQTGKGTGAGSSVGQGASAATQRSGTAVAVSGAASTGSLDLSQVDKALAGSAGANPGASGAAQSATTGGPATGASATGGTGTGGTGTASFNVVWEKPDANVGRTLLSTPLPWIPSWVGAQGLTLSVTVGFTLQPDGVMAAVTLEQSCGYPDVDSAVIDAIRRWRFNAAKVTTSVRGIVPYVIKTR